MKDLTDKGLLEHYTGLAMQSLIQRGGQLPINSGEAVTIAAGVVKALRKHTAENKEPASDLGSSGRGLVKVDICGEKVLSAKYIHDGQILFWKNGGGEAVKVRVESTKLAWGFDSQGDSTYAWHSGRVYILACVSYAVSGGVAHATVPVSDLYKVVKGLRPCPGRDMNRATVEDLVLGGYYSTLKEDNSGGLYWKDVHISSLWEGYKEDPWLKIVVRDGAGKKELVSLDDLYYDPAIPIY